ncbi:hypothetical protein CHLRE_04g220900v5 [Chlamydomonas reinhardtii]|uniref:Glycosyl transferase CAP10 domain-containing protein n=1 Tax=Chlamydomonas reinhardtii TaxID=3055 RepID=A8ISU5_CHLRE|nr:uncharacterized protein CHLRE_04g220900v5 [Chlamydomonas reinhardtii]PNW84102.1 hypothetical protein CHLRE_04g220900v5 [Chlamydomonas reinhardtii]|eukprot:XP_001692274.1 predicted protein [Chlamydomonas reinhardtii]
MTVSRAIWIVQALALVGVCGRGTVAELAAALGPPALPHTAAPLTGVHPWTVARPEWDEFLRQNLEADLEPWRKRAPLQTKEVIKMFDHYRKELPPDLLLLVLVYNNTLYWLETPEGPATREVPRTASPYKQWLHTYLTKALARRRLQLPNVLFIYNTFDNGNRIGKPTRNITVPPFSLCKSRGWYDGDDLDILVPQMMAIPDALHSVPWHLKKDLAFFRGVPSCSRMWEQTYKREEACSRMHLAYLSERDRRAGNATALDVGLADEYKVVGEKKSTPYELPKYDRVPLETHAHYKWLLNLEGVVAAYRMGQLLAMNSLVLHQRTYFIEYFYRSLQPWVHYVPFWNATGSGGEPAMDDVYGVLEDVRRLDREQPVRVQQIIANGQAVAKMLGKSMRLEYYRAALEGYKALFPDMDSFVEAFVQTLRSKGSDIP